MTDAGADTGHLYDDSKFGDICVKLDVQNRLKTKPINRREFRAYEFRVKILDRALEVMQKDHDHEVQALRHSLQDIYIKTPYFDSFWKCNSRSRFSFGSSATWERYPRNSAAIVKVNKVNASDEKIASRRQRKPNPRLEPLSPKRETSAARSLRPLSAQRSRTTQTEQRKSVKTGDGGSSVKSNSRESFPFINSKEETDDDNMAPTLTRSKSLPAILRLDSEKPNLEIDEKTRPTTGHPALWNSPSLSFPEPPKTGTSESCTIPSPIQTPEAQNVGVKIAVPQPRRSSCTLPLIATQTVKRRRGEITQLERLDSSKKLTRLSTNRKSSKNKSHVTDIEEMDPFTLRISTKNQMRKAKFYAKNLEALYEKRVEKPKVVVKKPTFEEMPQNGLLRAAFITQMNKRPGNFFMD